MSRIWNRMEWWWWWWGATGDDSIHVYREAELVRWGYEAVSADFKRICLIFFFSSFEINLKSGMDNGHGDYFLNPIYAVRFAHFKLIFLKILFVFVVYVGHSTLNCWFSLQNLPLQHVMTFVRSSTQWWQLKQATHWFSICIIQFQLLLLLFLLLPTKGAQVYSLLVFCHHIWNICFVIFLTLSTIFRSFIVRLFFVVVPKGQFRLMKYRFLSNTIHAKDIWLFASG